MKEEKVLAYHFTNGMRLRDGQELIEGKTYVHEGKVQICSSGLHASRRVIDALQYAPSGTLSIVECSGIVEEHRDKFVCRERKVLETHDVIRVLQDFALDVAEEVVRNYCKIEEDTRPFDAIRIARLYVDGKATFEELKDARNAVSFDYTCSTYYANQTVRSALDCVLYHSADRIDHVTQAAFCASYDFHDDSYGKTISDYNTELIQRLQKVFKTYLDF